MTKTEGKDVTNRVDVDALLADEAGFATAVVDIPGFGSMEVRELSRAELRRVYSLHEQTPGDVGPAETFMVHKALVDPPMTLDQVERWASKPSGKHMGLLVDRVNELSGVVEGAAKEATKSVLDE